MIRAIVKRVATLVGARGKEVSSRPGSYRHEITEAMLHRYSDRRVSMKEIARAQGMSASENYCARRVSGTLNKMLADGEIAFNHYEPYWPYRLAGCQMLDVENEKCVGSYQRWEDRVDAACNHWNWKRRRLRALCKAA